MNHVRVFGCAAYAHVKQDKLPRALKCVFIGYPQGVKGYRLWYIEKGSEKCIISRDVVFNEQEMPLPNDIKATDSTDKGGADLEVKINQGKDCKTAGDSETEQVETQGLEESDESDSYQLVTNRAKRVSKPKQRYSFADLISHALSTFLETPENEPETYHEAMKDKDKEKWLQAMRDEMNSLKKNGTWILLKHLRIRN